MINCDRSRSEVAYASRLRNLHPACVIVLGSARLQACWVRIRRHELSFAAAERTAGDRALDEAKPARENFPSGERPVCG